MESDSLSVIQSYNSRELTKKSKHIDVKYLDVRAQVRNEKLLILGIFL